MKDDLRDMFRKVIIFDVILSVILYWTTNMFFKDYTLVLLLGFAVAFLSFVCNGIITQYSLIHKSGNYKLIAIIGFIIRIAIICGIALMLFKHNKFDVIVYIIGYSLHFISLILYGIDVKNK